MAKCVEAVDVLILTILSEEYQALATELKRCGCGPAVRHPGTNQHAWHRYHIHSDQGDYHVVLGSAGNACNDFMQAAALDGLTMFEPAVLMVVGIGGGLPKDQDQMHPGDIVFGNVVWDVDRGKIGKRGLQARALSQLAGGGLLANVQAIAAHGPDWCAGLQNANKQPPSVIIGGIAASNKVQTVAEHEIVRAIRDKTGDTVRAVDMESFGAAIACESYRSAAQKTVSLAIVRGLSDIVRPAIKQKKPVRQPERADAGADTAGGAADGAANGMTSDMGKANSAERDVWKIKAAEHAARLTVALIKGHWPYSPRETGAPAVAAAATVPPTATPAAPAAPPVSAPPIPLDISRISAYAPAQLLGRQDETARLAKAWEQAQRGDTGRARVLAFVALGGEGKTSLVAKWALDLADRGWPGCEAVFAWSFYSQGTREQVAASSDLFLKTALGVFGDPGMGESAADAHAKGQRLAALVGARRALLILDGLEPLQYAPASPMAGKLKDQGMRALLLGLAADNAGLCVLTTRYPVADLQGFADCGAPQLTLARLPSQAGVALLRACGVRGGAGEFAALVERVGGHALTLSLLGSYLRDAHEGDIRKSDVVPLLEADMEESGGHAFRVMDAYAKWFEGDGEAGRRALATLRLLGLFDRPASAACLDALLAEPAIAGLTEPLLGCGAAQRKMAISRLETARLLTVSRDEHEHMIALDAHPLLREYFALRVREQTPEAWRTAHGRLYAHLCAATVDKDAPELDDLQPLYQAVAHGCLAGMQQQACEEVYRARILRRDEFYSTKKLYAFGPDLGAIACFFEETWSRVSPALTGDYQAWLLAQAGFCLRALGRLREALEPIRAGLAMHVKQENWEEAARAAGNLSALTLTLGDLAAAVDNGAQAVAYAERSGDASIRMVRRADHADTLHQAGRRDAARQGFGEAEAEALQAEREPDAPLLYSLRGFQYCDLLLADTERAAWRRMLRDPDPAKPVGDASAQTTPSASDTPPCRQPLRPGPEQDRHASGAAACAEASRRAAQALAIAEQYTRQLDIGLDRLTLGRAALYAAILDDAPLSPCQLAIQHAVDGLRRAGAQEFIPRALLTRAWLRALCGQFAGPDSAEADLAEAWEIAERGPMPLFMADIHLHRARLSILSNTATRHPPAAWPAPARDLAEARRLIEKHGYLRRMEELEDAEAALRG